MPATKTAGILCVLAASFLAGFWMENRLKKHWYLLRETYEMLSFLLKEMTFHCSLLPEAFRSAAAHATTEAADVLKTAADQLTAEDGRTFDEIWKSAVQEALPPNLLSEEEYALFLGLSPALCAEDPVIQKTLLEKYAARFFSMEQRGRGGLQRKGAIVPLAGGCRRRIPDHSSALTGKRPICRGRKGEP